MSKIVFAIGLAGLLLATASTTGSSAMTIVPLSKARSVAQRRPRPSEMATMLARTAADTAVATGVGAIAWDAFAAGEGGKAPSDRTAMRRRCRSPL
jgi:hypothetical protein